MPALDGIRGLAILLILVHHAYSNLIPQDSVLGAPIPGSFIGVDLFFALSGFLITSLLLHEHESRGAIGMVAFYRRRALRLLPALYALLSIFVVYAIATGKTVSFEEIFPVATYWQNWSYLVFDADAPAELGHMWSLAVEEQFYLVWPLLMVALVRVRHRPALFAGAFVAILAAMNVHRLMMWEGPVSAYRMYAGTDTRGDALVVGALAAYLSTRGRLPRRVLGIGAWLSVGFIVYCVTHLGPEDRFYYSGGFTLVGVATSVIILASIEGAWAGRRVLVNSWLRTLGMVSYGLYLWHYPIYLAVERNGAGLSTPGRLVAAAAITAAVTTLSWHVVERPFLRWKDRLERSRREGRRMIPAMEPSKA